MAHESSKAEEGFAFDAAPQDFAAYLQFLRAQAAGLGLRPGEVPQTTFWLVNSNRRLLGLSRLRHWLTPALEEYGGHIGYLIRPTERRKGFGTKILALTLEKASELALACVRLTCDTENIASARIIERNGGVLSGYGVSPVNGKQTSQYWIQLGSARSWKV